MKKRVVAYIRVSSSSDAQLHSFDFQEQYWMNRFAEDPEHELIGLYADQGISGKSIYKRPEFLRMLEDAREKKFDSIFTKSVSRFARNTTQLLETIRELRDLGIEVFFENENISTLQPASELYLTIAATIAENDLAVDAARQRWSIQRRYEEGWVSIGCGMYGLRKTEQGTLVVVPEEAEIIRDIFEKYIGGEGIISIANSLNRRGIMNYRGAPWRPNNILKIITNEKYMGDIMTGRSVRVDGIKKENLDGKYGNRYYMENTHEAIVSKEAFQKAQEVRKSRENPKLIGYVRPVYPFSGLIECGVCQHRFSHKINNAGTKYQSDIWACWEYLQHGKNSCSNTRIKDSVLREKFVEAYNEFVTMRPQGETEMTLLNSINELRQEEEELAALVARNMISRSAFLEAQKDIHDDVKAFRAQLLAYRGKSVRESDFALITEFNPEKVEKFISKVIVLNGTVTFRFYNGVELTKEYTNGAPGNKPGWNKKERN